MNNNNKNNHNNKNHKNNNSKPFVLGITGKMSCGKDTLANHLVKKYGFRKLIMSNILREEARKRGMTCVRENLRKIQAELRRDFGEDYLITKMTEIILTRDHLSMKRVALIGLRTKIDASLAKEKLDAKLIYIETKPELRFLRQKKRKRAGFHKNYKDFMDEDRREAKAFDFTIIKRMADFKLENNGTKKELYKRFNKIAEKLRL